MEHWVSISEKDAKEHPLYGVRGWLIVIPIAIIIYVFVVRPLFIHAAIGRPLAPPVTLIIALLVAGAVFFKAKSTRALSLGAFAIQLLGGMIVVGAQSVYLSVIKMNGRVESFS